VRRVRLFSVLAAAVLAAAMLASSAALPLVAAGARPALQEADSAAAALDVRAAAIASQLRCLVCRGQSVLESSSELARQIYALIREQVAEGKSEEEIKAYFVSRYGEWILLQPKPRGVNLLVYALPLVAILGGAILLRARFRRWAADAETTGVTESDLSERDEEWLRDQLRKV